jgi:8-oxo-dGTP pyrophosphatase MutT (NUDIX family)
MREFEILIRGCFNAGQLVISYDETLSMPRTPTISDWIEEQWRRKQEEARARSTALYDAPLYRLESAEVRLDGRLYLRLGATDYKEYVATRDERFAQSHPRDRLSNPLAVCSVIETRDGYLLLDRRQHVDVYEGRYHVIGGFCERGRDCNAAGLPDPFLAIEREVREETGIGPGDIARRLCLGLVYDLVTPHPELCFLTGLSITLQEVRQRQPADHEVAELLSLPASAESLRSFLFTYHGTISATGEPNLLLYGGWRFGEAWYAETLWRLT